jgi:transcriptional antiterminator RfaH
MSTAALRWFAVQTHPHAELRAAAHLLRQGFGVYLPRYLRRRRHARRTETVPAPLFPRYLFVAVDLATQRWRAIQSTHGVAQLVCAGGVPAPVPDAVIAELRARERDGFVHLPPRPHFAPGTAVRILDGAFASCIGLYDGMKDGDRVAILLDLLGRKVRVLIESELVAAA